MERSVDYDRVAPAYDRRYELSQYSGIERSLLEFAGEQRPLRVLEVGCGTGHWLHCLHSHGYQVAGLDASQGMLEAARKRLPAAPLVRGVAERLPWRDASFDRVICINAVHHFRDKPAFCREARRVLVPGGALLSIGLDPHPGLDRWYIYDYFDRALEDDLRRYPACEAIRGWMSDAGFEPSSTQVAQHIDQRVEAGQALERGTLARSFTSQLSVLTDDEYQRGLDKLQAARQAAQSRGEPLMLHADLRLYATHARSKVG